jgi:diguanylate cyclase (GGDEF)-like protein/PAS domain S-box-containing protein
MGDSAVDAGVEVTSAERADDVSRGPVEERYRQLLEHSPDPLCVHADGRVVYVNPAGVRGIAAQSADELVGRMITDFVHPDSIAPMLDRISALERDGDSSTPSEAVMLRLDGSPVDAEVVSVLTRWDGKPAYQVIFRDLTMVKAAEAALRYQAALVTHATDAIIGTTLAGTVTSWNPAAETIYRRPARHALAMSISDAVGAPVDPAAIVDRGGVEHVVHQSADGIPLCIRISAAAMNNGYVLVCSDHTALRRAERRFQTVVNSLDEGVVVLDALGQPESMNPAARHILGLPESGAVPESYLSNISRRLSDADGRPMPDGRQLVERALAAGLPVRNKIVGYDRPDGSRRWLSVNCRPLDPAESGPQAMLASFIDITDQHNTQVQLNHQANHDWLTGLPNRAYAEARASLALRSDPPELAAVVFIDLDNLKAVNDAFGHQAGDTVIRTAAQRLRGALRADDFIARHGGDEFVALLFGHTNDVVLDHLTERLHAALAPPVDVAGGQFTLTASIGVAHVKPGETRDAAQLLCDADAAMYKAKVHRATTHYAEDLA